jgi:hypothetical protein
MIRVEYNFTDRSEDLKREAFHAVLQVLFSKENKSFPDKQF